MKFLIAESDSFQREIISNTVERFGDCLFADDGFETVRIFVDSLEKKDSFAAVFMSANIPGLDGQHVLRQIRTIEKDEGLGLSEEVPVIIMGVLYGEQIMEAYMRGNYTSYLSAPLTEDKIMEEMALLGIVS